MFKVIRKVWPNPSGEVIGEFASEEEAAALILRQIANDEAAMRVLYGNAVQGPIKAPYLSKDTKSLYGYEVYARVNGQIAGAVECWANAVTPDR